jgi:hypothetical protein
MSEKTILGLYDEIVKIRQLLEIVVKDNLKKELEKILTTKKNANMFEHQVTAKLTPKLWQIGLACML